MNLIDVGSSPFFKDSRFKKVRKTGEEYRTLWLNNFATNITKEEQLDVYMDQFLWHSVSYKLIDAMEEDDARIAFRDNVGVGWSLFFQNCEDVFVIVDDSGINDEVFDNIHDVYIVNDDMTKCYIHTHESYCGPYYISKS